VRASVAYALASAALFGVSTPLAKLFIGGVSPLMLAGLLYAGSGVGLLAILVVRALLASDNARMSLPSRDEWPWLAGAILFGGIAGPVALMYGLVTTTASTASLLLNLETVLTAVLAWFVFRENFDRRVMLGMILIVAGGLMLAWTPAQSSQASFGVLLIAVACLCWALDNNLTRKVSASDPVFISSLKGAVAGAVNLGLALMLGHALPPVSVATAAAIVGFMGYGISLVLFVLALRHLGTARTGAYFSVAPFFGAALAVALSEPLTWQLVAGGSLMGLGVWLHLTERHAHAHEHVYQEHSHAHIHDEHHEHAHDFAWDGREPHTHGHAHGRLIHTHSHYPDVHHRHPH